MWRFPYKRCQVNGKLSNSSLREVTRSTEAPVLRNRLAPFSTLLVFDLCGQLTRSISQNERSMLGTRLW